LTEAATDFLRRVEAVYPHQVLGLVRAGERYYLLNARDLEWSERTRLRLLALRLREAYLTPERRETGAAPGASPPPGGFTCLAVSRAEREGLTRAASGEIVLAAGQSLHLVNPQEPEVAVEVRAASDRPLSMGGILQRSAHAGIYAGLTGRAAKAPAGRSTIETPDATVIIQTASIGPSLATPGAVAPEPPPLVVADTSPPVSASPVEIALAAEPAAVKEPAAPEPVPVPVAVAPVEVALPPVEAALPPERVARAAPVVLPAMAAARPAPAGAVPTPYDDYARAMKTLMALKRSRSVLSVGEMTYVHPAVEVVRRQYP
jgi:hypothetical protein